MDGLLRWSVVITGWLFSLMVSIGGALSFHNDFRGWRLLSTG